MAKLFSRRDSPSPTNLRHDLPHEVRRRLHAIIDEAIAGDGSTLTQFMREMQTRLVQEYGILAKLKPSPANAIPALEHFFACTDAQAMDYIELSYQMRVQIGGQAAVDRMNEVLREEGIGFELTPYRGPAASRGAVLFGAPRESIEYPHVLRVQNQVSQGQIVRPALDLLAGAMWTTANEELLAAFVHHRSGRYADVFTAAGSAFESVLKIICDRKQWSHDPQRDTCGKLLEICAQNGLFPSRYLEPLKGLCTIRNGVGMAHGRAGASLPIPATIDNAEHFLHLVCTNVLFVTKLAHM